MGAHLDLYDLAHEHPEAMAELESLRQDAAQNQAFITALNQLTAFADAGYGVGITFDGHCGVWADIGSDCQSHAQDAEGWIPMATEAINRVLAKKKQSIDAARAAENQNQS